MAWCSSPESVYDFAVTNEYLQVDLGAVSQVCAVGTQGYRKQRIYSFELHYSVDGRNWSSVKEYEDNEVTNKTAMEFIKGEKGNGKANARNVSYPRLSRRSTTLNNL